MSSSLVLVAVAVATLGLMAPKGEGRTIDLGEAVLRQPPSGFHSDQMEDLFGYSGVLSHTGDPRGPTGFAEKLMGASLIVGVPNGTTESGALQRTGLVFSCPLLTSGSGPCQPTVGDLYDTTNNMGAGETGQSEDKSGQQMGFSMQSGQRLVVCAPGWVSINVDSGNTRQRQGRCLSMDQSLTNPMQLRPCTIDRDNSIHNPAINDDSEQGFGQCFSGIAVDVLSDGQVVMGAPGAFLYTGTAVVSASDTLAVSNNTDSPPLPPQGFLGMAVARGRILDTATDSFVIGSPRGAGLRGQVRVMRSDAVTVGMATPVRATFLENVVTVLDGEQDQVGAQFGTSLAAVDFNGDGYDEVVVGAPFFSNSARQPERGAVYIHGNNGGTLTDTNRTRIVGTVNSARFGHALTALGDLDGDGFDELAVSAPFGEGLPGTVFIYSGVAGTTIPVLSQTIVGSEVNLQAALLTGLTTFGAFIEGGTDIDGNCHNDLVIGAFGSRKVFVLRSRSVVVLTASVTPNVTVISADTPFFSVNYCLQASGSCFIPDQTVDVSYTLYADRPTDGRQPRVVFTTATGTVETETIERELTVNGPEICVMRTATVRNTNVDIQTLPVVPAINATVVQGDMPSPGNGMDVLTDLRANRIFSRLEGNTSAQLMAQRECGTDNICHFDLLFQSITVSEPLSGRVRLGFDDQVAVQAVVGSVGIEPAFSPIVRFNFSQGMTFQRTDTSESRICSPTGNSVDCILVGVVRPNTTVTITVFFGVSKTDVGLAGSNVSITAEILPPMGSGNNETNPSNNNGMVQFSVVAAADARVTTAQQDVVLPVISNSPRGTSLPTTLEEIGRNVSIPFRFLNDGPSMFSSGLATMYVPLRSGCTARSPLLFYLSSVTITNVMGTSASSCSSDPLEDFLGLAGGTSSEFQTNVSLPCIEGGRVNCSEEARCARVQCSFSSVASGDEAIITLFGYVDDHHFSGTSDGTVLEFLAEYSITDSDVVEGMPTNNQRTVIVEMRAEALPPTTEPIPWWVIAVPIVVAVLLLVVAFVLLYILGFFKRKRPGDEKQALVDDDSPPAPEGEAEAAEGEMGAASEENEGNTTAPESQEETAGDAVAKEDIV